jgi:hypothetical protein
VFSSLAPNTQCTCGGRPEMSCLIQFPGSYQPSNLSQVVDAIIVLSQCIPRSRKPFQGPSLMPSQAPYSHAS